MKFGRREKKKLAEIFEERSGDFVDRDGVHKEKYLQYLEMIGVLPQPCSLRPRTDVVTFKAGTRNFCERFFAEGQCWLSISKELATKILVLGFAPPRNKRKEKKVEYRLEKDGRKIGVAPTSFSAANKIFKLLQSARSDPEFTIFDPMGQVVVKISKNKGMRSSRHGV